MNSNFFHFQENKDSNKLVVVFSGVNAKNFMGYRLLGDLNCNKIFIREDNKSWYHSKIDGVSNNIDGLILFFQKVTKKFKKENITFVGSSMGAYAALLIGIKLNVGKIIAFGPQIIINKNFTNNPKDDSYIQYKDLTPLINKAKSRIEIMIGVNELLDLYHIKDIQNKKFVSIYRIVGQPHNVLFFIYKIGIFQDYIRSRVYNENYNLAFLNNLNVDLNKIGYLKKATEAFFIEKKYDTAKIYFNKLAKNYPSINTFWKYSGICSFYQNDFEEAIAFFKKSQLIVFADDELHYYLGLSFFKLKNYHAAQNNFKFALEFSSDRKLSYYIKLAICLRNLQRYDEALSVLNESLKINLKNYGTYYQIAMIYKKQNKLSLAVKMLTVAKNLRPNKRILDELKELHLFAPG